MGNILLENGKFSFILEDQTGTFWLIVVRSSVSLFLSLIFNVQ